jgi:hypothetical protein
MGLGSAMAGGNPASGASQPRGFYPTPADVTKALLSVEKFEGGIWEPACGNGAISKLLIAAGYKVVSTDIHPLGYGSPADFLKVEPRQVANIVTNPPFDLARKFIEHAMLFKPKKLALMLKATYWHAKNRHALFERYQPARVYPLLWRPDFMELGRPTMEVQWCVWDSAHSGGTIYQPLCKPV